MGQNRQAASQATTDQRSPRLTWLFAVVAILGVRIALSLVARATGFLEYNADGYARIVHAAAWSRAPHLEVGVWLPFHFWLTGAALWLWPDITTTPVAMSFAASLASAVLLAAIGHRLGGPAAGWLTGLLAAAFPWSVWFGLSGLAEALFAAAVSAAGLGLVAWERERERRRTDEGESGRGGERERGWVGGVARLLGRPALPRSPAPPLTPSPPHPLWLAGVALLVSAGLRYEGWFYSLALALVVWVGLTPAERWRPWVLAALAVPFVVPLGWVGASWLVHGDPFAFARITSEITAAEGTHTALTPLERLGYYPVFVVGLAWPVVLPALAAVVWLRRRPLVVYTAWIVAELLILAIVTSRFSGIGAGRDRYVMSNVVLLLPLVALLIVTLWRRATWGRLAAVALLALLVWFGGATLLGRQHPYPASDTVALAGRLRAEWAAGRLPADARLPVAVAVPGQADAFNESYALQVLTGRPTGFHFSWDLELFNRLVADQSPSAWITDDRLAHPARPNGQETETIGHYTLHRRPPPPVVQVAGPARPGGRVMVSATGLLPEERVGLWLTASDGQTVDLGQARADGEGRLGHSLALPARLPPGAYLLSVRGARTGATGQTRLMVE